MNKSLTKIISSLSLLGIVSCSPAPEYHFKDWIENEKVSFYESDSLFSSEKYLEITLLNTNSILYNAGKDFTINWVEINTGNKITRYTSDSTNEKVQEVITLSQTQFDEYLNKIHQIKTLPLQKILKK